MSGEAKKPMVVYNPSIHIDAREVRPGSFDKFTLVQTNLGAGVREQLYRKFDDRAPEHVAQLKAAMPDIVVMQELRSFADAKIQPDDFIYGVGKALGHRAVSGQRNAGSMAFGQTTTYNPARFFLKQTVTRWLSDTPTELSSESVVAASISSTSTSSTSFSTSTSTSSSSSESVSSGSKAARAAEWGSLVLATEFNLVQDGRVVWHDGEIPSFWVLNVHFPVQPHSKMACAKQLAHLISSEFSSHGRPVIVSGNLNTFYKENGTEQMAILEASGLVDISTSLKDLDGVRRPGTFLGFPHDEVKFDADTLNWLDHVLVSGQHLSSASVTSMRESAVLLARAAEMHARSTPSDHIALLVALEGVIKLN